MLCSLEIRGPWGQCPLLLNGKAVSPLLTILAVFATLNENCHVAVDGWTVAETTSKMENVNQMS